MRPDPSTRRRFLRAVPALVGLQWWSSEGQATAPGLPRGQAERALRITGMEVTVVRATVRTNWLFVRLVTNTGLTGLGEASMGRLTDLPELERFFALIRDASPFEIERYRSRGLGSAGNGDHRLATAFSAIEQAQWDLVGKALDAPLYVLFGGRLRPSLPVYANINRATTDRSPRGFAATAGQASEDGFRAVKAAPFDGFSSLDAPADDVARATDIGVACIEAMRSAIDPDIALKIDFHSNFDVDLAVDVTRRLDPQQLSWYEEPVPPTDLDDTKAIHDAIAQTMAGGEFLFLTEGFVPLCRDRAVDIIMPAVKHCGGVTELRKIATIAEGHDVLVSPHNPSGPVSTAASAEVCAGMPNFDILEYQWNEVPWRSELVDPPERFSAITLPMPDGPGIGVTLNDAVVRAHG